MHEWLVKILCCPGCRAELKLSVFSEIERSADVYEAANPNDDVTTGLLTCTCGNCYPIVEGVPRLLVDGLNGFAEIPKGHRSDARIEVGLHSPKTRPKEDDYGYIRQSFSREWEMFDYDTDKTWGWTLEERRRVFMDDMALAEDQLKGKLLLDAGCGNGTLTAVLSTLGMNIVGIDLSDDLGRADRNKTRYSGEYSKNVQYVQGNLCDAPFKLSSFDLVYCSGVIHHTPDTKQSFKKLVPLVKEGGRLYVWVYSKRNLFVRVYMDAGRQLKRAMSPRSLLTTCRLLAPCYKLGTDLLNCLHVAQFRSRNVREITLDLFDCFAPQYNHRHSEEEVVSWFKEEGFANVTVSGRQKHGSGVRGDRI